MRVLINGYLCSPCAEKIGGKDKLEIVNKEDLINQYLYCRAYMCNNASDYCDYDGSFYGYRVYKKVDIDWLLEDE